jgi:hypothetical protein
MVADSAAIKGWIRAEQTAEPQALALTNHMWMKTQLKKKENPIQDDLVLDLTHPELPYPIVQ